MEIPWNKTVIQEGSGQSPSDGYNCLFKIEVTSGQIDKPNFQDEDKTKTLIICKRASTPAFTLLNNCIKSMQVGEISTFSLSLDSLQKLDISLNSESNLSFQVHLISMERPVQDMSTAERLNYATEEKASGTQYFKDGNIELAFNKFSIAAKVLISISKHTATQDEHLLTEIRQLRCLVHCNLALCQLKTKYYEGVIKNCDIAISIDPCCQKAFFRRGQAYIDLKNYEAAKRDFEKLCHLDPKNKAAQKEVLKLDERLKNSDKVLGKALSKMFV